MLFGRNKKNPIKMVDKGVVEWRYTTCGTAFIQAHLDGTAGGAITAGGVAPLHYAFINHLDRIFFVATE